MRIKDIIVEGPEDIFKAITGKDGQLAKGTGRAYDVSGVKDVPVTIDGKETQLPVGYKVAYKHTDDTVSDKDKERRHERGLMQARDEREFLSKAVKYQLLQKVNPNNPKDTQFKFNPTGVILPLVGFNEKFGLSRVFHIPVMLSDLKSLPVEKVKEITRGLTAPEFESMLKAVEMNISRTEKTKYSNNPHYLKLVEFMKDYKDLLDPIELFNPSNCGFIKLPDGWHFIIHDLGLGLFNAGSMPQFR